MTFSMQGYMLKCSTTGTLNALAKTVHWSFVKQPMHIGIVFKREPKICQKVVRSPGWRQVRIMINWLVHGKLPLYLAQWTCQHKASWKECKTTRQSPKRKRLQSRTKLSCHLEMWQASLHSLGFTSVTTWHLLWSRRPQL